MVTVDLWSAVICFVHAAIPQCHPVLFGDTTPTGVFPIILREVVSPGYSGDVLQFHEEGEYVFSIHRTWNGRPSERRGERLRGAVEKRKITKGCINVAPEVYEKLKACCQGQTLIINEGPK